MLSGTVFSLVLLLSLLIPQTALSQSDKSVEVQIKTSTKFYDFRAYRFRDVLRQMLLAAPAAGAFGRKVWAQAQRKYDIKLEYSQTGGKCSIRNAIIAMEITYILPRLENENEISSEFKQKWAHVYRILRHHELAHGRNYAQLAERLKIELAKLGPHDDCKLVKNAVDELDSRLHHQDLEINRRFEFDQRKRFKRIQRLIEQS